MDRRGNDEGVSVRKDKIGVDPTLTCGEYNMTERIIIAGFGGQGIMLLGKVIAIAAMNEGRRVSWFPSYGAEVRGGTAHCLVTISDEPISSPLFESADAVFVFNQPSFAKFKQRVSRGGTIIINSTLVDRSVAEKHINVVKLPFTAIAADMGNVKVANMVALGAYLAKNKAVSLDSVLKTFKELAPKGREDLIEINEKALRKGMSLG